MPGASPAVAPRPPARYRRDSLPPPVSPRRDVQVLPRTQYPWAIERDYQRKLLSIVDRIHKDLDAKLAPVLKSISTEVDERHAEKIHASRSRGQRKRDRAWYRRRDSVASNIAAVVSVVEQVKREWRDPAVTDEYLEGLARSTDSFATRQIFSRIESVIGVDLFADPKRTTRYAAFARENSALITSIQTQYLDEVAEKAQKALRTGSSTRQLRRDIEDRYGVTRSRANLIARDQIGKLNGQISQDRQTELGLDSYQWSTSEDERVRQSHHALDGKIFKWDDPPVTNPQGDRNHPGGDYQCFVPGTAVEGSVVAGIRSAYEGRVVELETRTGRRLTVTPNHPVLTPAGWVAAGGLHEGDHLLCGGPRVAPVNAVEPQDGPVVAEQVFGALLELGEVSSVVLRPDDLHGDAVGVQGDVQVADAVSVLLGHAQALASQLVGDLGLPPSDPGEALHVGAGDLEHVLSRLRSAAGGFPSPRALPLDGSAVALDLGPLRCLRSALSSRLHSLSLKLADDGRPGDAEILGDLVDRLASPEQTDSAGQIGHASVGLDERRLPGVAHLDAVLAEALDEGGRLDPLAASNLVGRLPGVVALDQVVKIRDRCFAGHVYDLQTLSGFIVAEGIICSNCRCIPEAVLEDDDIEELKEAGAERKSRTELRREKAVAEGRPVARWREDEPFTPKTLAQHIMDLGHWEEGNLSRAIMTSEGLTFNPTPAQKFSKGIPEDTAKALTNADIFPPGTVLSDGTNEIVIEDSSQIGPIDLTNRHSWVALMEGAEDLTVISLGKKP